MGLEPTICQSNLEYRPAIENLFLSNGSIDIRVDADNHRISVWCPFQNVELSKPLCALKHNASIPPPSLCADDYTHCFEFFTKKFRVLTYNIKNLTNMVKACFGDVDPIMARNHLTEGYLYYFMLIILFLLSYFALYFCCHIVF